MKRLISIIITGALLLGILSAGAFASANTTGDVTEFTVDFGTAVDGTNFKSGDYATTGTSGSNWIVNDSLTYSAVLDTAKKCVRIQDNKSTYNFTQVKYNNSPLTSVFAVDFTAPSEGMYDVTALVTLMLNYGMGNIYINGTCVGTIDSYATANQYLNTPPDEQPLISAYLKAGEYANTLAIVPNGKASTGTGTMVGMQGVKFTKRETAGFNWKVDASATASGQKDGTEHAPRIQVLNGTGPENTYNFITIKDRGDLALKFTAPTGAGTYDVSAIVNPMTGGGYGDIYVNGKYIGSVDSYDTTAHLYNSAVVTQDLYTAELYDGEYANTLVITPAGDENVFMQSFTFDKTTGEGSADEISVEKYVTSGLATVDAISAYMTDGTLIGSNVIGSGHVAIGGVYTVTAPDKSAEGYNFLYWAKGTSDKKRIVGYGDTLTYNPQEGRTSLIAVYEKADSVTNKAEFYNANGELIESNATGVFPAFPSMAGLRQATGWKCWNDGKIYDGSEAVVPEGTVIYVADYGELSEVFVNGDKYTYGDPVTLTATEANFKGWVKNGEIVSTNKTYTFLAYETCTVTEMTGDKELSAKLVKIALDDFVSGDITAVMAEFIGLDNAVEKGIMFDNGKTVSKIAMTGDGNQFTVTADEEGTYTGYAVIRKGSSFTIIEDGEYEHGN